MSEELKQWWNAIHQNQDKHYLGIGSNPFNQWDNLDVLDLLVPDKKILYIGVGDAPIKDLYSKGLKITALDISPYAEATVKDQIEGFYLDSSLLPENTFDLSISYLVAQHMSNKDLTAQLTNVVKSLKPDGVMAIQFFYFQEIMLEYIYKYYSPNPISWQKFGSFGRTKEMISKIVLEAGGKVTYWGKHFVFNEYEDKPEWQIVHIMKA